MHAGCTLLFQKLVYKRRDQLRTNRVRAVYPQNHRGNGRRSNERCCRGGRLSDERCCWSRRRSSQRCCCSGRLSSERYGWSWRRRRGRRGRPKQRFDDVKRKRSQQQKQHAHDNARHRVRLLFGWPCEGELRATSRAHGVDTFREINHLLTVRLLAVASVEASII